MESSLSTFPQTWPPLGLPTSDTMPTATHSNDPMTAHTALLTIISSTPLKSWVVYRRFLWIVSTLLLSSHSRLQSTRLCFALVLMFQPHDQRQHPLWWSLQTRPSNYHRLLSGISLLLQRVQDAFHAGHQDFDESFQFCFQGCQTFRFVVVLRWEGSSVAIFKLNSCLSCL